MKYMASKNTKTVEAERTIDEARLDNNRRAKDMMDYEQMLMNYIENEVKQAVFNERF